MNKFTKVVLNVFLPMFIGSAIYSLSRSNSILSNKFFPYSVNINGMDTFPAWVKFNLPDGLWLYSFLSAIKFIWKGEYSPQYLSWLTFVCLLTFSSEILQGLHIIPGTFDWHDMLAYFIAITFFSLTHNTPNTNLNPQHT